MASGRSFLEPRDAISGSRELISGFSGSSRKGILESRASGEPGRASRRFGRGIPQKSQGQNVVISLEGALFLRVRPEEMLQ